MHKIRLNLLCCLFGCISRVKRKRVREKANKMPSTEQDSYVQVTKKCWTRYDTLKKEKKRCEAKDERKWERWIEMKTNERYLYFSRWVRQEPKKECHSAATAAHIHWLNWEKCIQLNHQNEPTDVNDDDHVNRRNTMQEWTQARRGWRRIMKKKKKRNERKNGKWTRNDRRNQASDRRK